MMMMTVKVATGGARAKGRSWPAVAVAAAVAIIVVFIAGSGTAIRSGWLDIRDLGFYQTDRIQSRATVCRGWHMVIQRTGTSRACHTIRHASGTAA